MTVPQRTDIHDPTIILTLVWLLSAMTLGVSLYALTPTAAMPLAEGYAGLTPELVLLAVGLTAAALTKLFGWVIER